MQTLFGHTAKYLFCCVFLLTTVHSPLFGIDNRPVGARSAAMGNASVSVSDVWSAHNNQAGLAFIKNYSCGIYYENSYLIKELSQRVAVASLPTKAGTIGIEFSNFGYTKYNENKYNLSFAKAFGEKFSIGIAMNYMSIQIAEGYGNKGIAAAEIGVLSKPLKQLTIGAHLFNPTQSKLAQYDNERVPTIFRLGGNYAFSEQVVVAFEVEKNVAKKAVFKTGIEYKPINYLYIRGGISTSPTQASLGCGFRIQSLSIDVSSCYNPILGFSPQIGLSYSFSKN